MRLFLLIVCASFIFFSCKDPVLPGVSVDKKEINKLETQIKNNKSRDIWQRPSDVLDFLGDIEGKTVADIGAGTGFFSFRLLFRNAKVIAIDIDPKMIELIESFKQNLSLDLQNNITTRLALPADPKIRKDEAEVILIINTIGYIENRSVYLKNLYDKLPVNGQIMIVDFKSRQLPIDAPSQEFRVPLFQIENDLTKAGFEDINSNDSMLDYQYLVIGTKKVAQ